MIGKLLRARRSARLYVTADADDNSVTFSEHLYKRIARDGIGDAKVIVIRLSDTGEYAFVLNPAIEQETQLADIQINTQHNCIGFESLVPTVNRIFFDYGIPPSCKCRLSVRREETPGLVYWRICRPTVNTSKNE